MLLITFFLVSSFIENFGTHVITSVTIGGKDVIYVKQQQSSPLSATEMKNYVQEIGNQRFMQTQTPTSSGPIRVKDKASLRMFLLLVFSINMSCHILDSVLMLIFFTGW